MAAFFSRRYVARWFSRTEAQPGQSRGTVSRTRDRDPHVGYADTQGLSHRSAAAKRQRHGGGQSDAHRDRLEKTAIAMAGSGVRLRMAATLPGARTRRDRAAGDTRPGVGTDRARVFANTFVGTFAFVFFVLPPRLLRRRLRSPALKTRPPGLHRFSSRCSQCNRRSKCNTPRRRFNRTLARPRLQYRRY